MIQSASRSQQNHHIRAGAPFAAALCALVHSGTALGQGVPPAAPAPGAAAPAADSPPGSSAPANPQSNAPVSQSAPPTGAAAELPPASTMAPSDPPPGDASVESKPFTKTVGGHVGIATPLVTVAKDTKTIGDQFTILNPIGIGFHISDDWIVDFEMVVASPIHPTGTTGLVIDPGVVHSFGRVALGLRLAFQTNHDANVGLIPLLNVGLVDLGGATWFVEAAFPTFYYDQTGEFNAVLHTGVGF